MGRWGSVKNTKEKGDKKRAAEFTRLARHVTIAAREGGGDPSFNFQLRSAIDRALAGNMPKDNIDRAIKKGTGELAGDAIESVVYEGYGPAGIAILVEALTDNRNRTSGNVKHAFSANGGNMGATGSVQWMFVRSGIVTCGTGASSSAGATGQVLTDDQEMALIDAGAEDIAHALGEDGVAVITVQCAPDALGKVRAAAESAGLKIASAEFTWNAKDAIAAPTGVQREELEGLLEELDDDEDVSAVYTNAAL